MECSTTLLSGINPRRYSYIWHKYAPVSAHKPLYSVLKVELLQSDKHQPTIMDEPVINTSIVNLPPEQPSSLVTTVATLDSGNPIVSALQPLQCAMCGQLKSSHPSGCPSYGISCSACGIVGHKLIFCRKVIALKKATSSSPSRNNRPAKQRSDKKSKRKEKSSDSSSEDDKIVKKVKKVNFTEESDYDSDPHVYMSRITPDNIDLSDHNSHTSSPPTSPPLSPAPEPDQPAPPMEDFDPYIAYQDDEDDNEEYHEPPKTPPTFDPVAILDSTATYHRRYFPQPLNANGDRYLLHKAPKQKDNQSKFFVGTGSPINQIVTLYHFA